MAFTRIRKARLWPQKHRSGNVTWKVLVGKKNDRQNDIRSFETEALAKTFRDDWNAKLVTNNTNGLTDLNTLARAEVLTALAKLEGFNATLLEAVDFFIKHARPERRSITVEEAVDMFLKDKADLKRRGAYLRNCRKTFYQPFARAFPKRNIADISENEAQKYLSKHREWSSSTKASHISYLRTFYQFFIKKRYAKLNPFQNIEKPRAISINPKLTSPEQAGKLLQFALDNGHPAECATMALVFFCGVNHQLFLVNPAHQPDKGF